jgi:hypothetical protein
MTRALAVDIQDRILVVRDHLVMLDADLAELYGVATKHLNGPIKIGWTKNLLVRLRAFSTMFPMPLRLLGVIPGDVEDWWHERFAAFRLGGEWFAPMPELLEFIRERAKTPPDSCQWFGEKRQ